MLMANGQSPTPRICPTCVASRSNSAAHCCEVNERVTKQKEVAIRAMKLAQNSQRGRWTAVGRGLEACGRSLSGNGQMESPGK